MSVYAYDCPDAEVCKTCPCADEDDVCFPGERLRADLARAVVLDEDLLANLDARAERHNTDSAGYLRWILTGKAPQENPAKPRRKKP